MPITEHPSSLSDASGGIWRPADVCVVGSGPAGAIVAVELAGLGVDVVLLESGSSDPDHDLERTLDKVDVSGGADLRFGFSRQLGGATNLWSGRLAPFEPIDFARRDWVPQSGWPINRDDLAPYYTRVGHLLGIPGHDRFGERPSPHIDLLSSEQIEIKTFQWAGRPFNSGHYVSSAARQRDNLHLVLNAHVTRLNENRDANRVETAEVALRDGRTAQCRARFFVLAAGGIETPRILLNSDSVRPAGIGNDRDVAGRFLSTHPKANVASLILKKAVSTRHPLFTDRSVDGGLMRYGLGLTGATQQRYALLNHYVQLLPFLEYQANELFEKIKGSSALDSPLIDRTPLIRGIVPGIGLIAFEAMGRLGKFQRRARKFILRAFLDQYPSCNNRVTLSEMRDQHGARKADVRWTWSSDDRESVIRFFDVMDSDVHSRGMGHIEYGKLKSTEDWPLIGIHSHFMGTTRMGTDPGSSVTTADCRVHGSENLFLAGPSLFPVYGYANPVYTIGALSLRLADHLKEKLR
jgi:choline dehydrogenase-like flavoprotein